MNKENNDVINKFLLFGTSSCQNYTFGILKLKKILLEVHLLNMKKELVSL